MLLEQNSCLLIVCLDHIHTCYNRDYLYLNINAEHFYVAFTICFEMNLNRKMPSCDRLSIRYELKQQSAAQHAVLLKYFLMNNGKRISWLCLQIS